MVFGWFVGKRDGQPAPIEERRAGQAVTPKPVTPPPSVADQPATVDSRTGKLNIPDLRDRESKANITKFYTEENAEIERATRVAREKNSGKIPPEIFNDIIEARKKALPAFIEKVAQISSSTPDGRPVSKEWIKQQTQAASDEMNALVTAEVIKANRARHPEIADTAGLAALDKQVNGAFYAAEKEVPSKGFLGGMLGKMSTTGMIGAGIGVLVGSLFSGGLSGGIMGIISTVLLAVGGMYLGNKYSEMKESKPVETPPATPKPKPEEKQAGGKGKEYTSLIDGKELPRLVVNSDPALLVGAPANTPISNRLALTVEPLTK